MEIQDDAGLLTEHTVERLGNGSILTKWSEGPVWLPSRRVVRFSDLRADRILEWSADTNQISVYRDHVEFTNGRTIGLDGEVVQCSHGRRRIEVDRDGAVTGLADHWHGKRFNSPNDVIVKSDGTVWFSDPSYGIKRAHEGHPGDLEYGDHWVWRFDPSDGSVEPVILDVEMPNGLAFSPDESLLYSSDNSKDAPDAAAPNPDGTHAIRVYHVRDGRMCKGGRDFRTITDGITDGIRVDERGNVWSAEFSGIHIYSPAGEQIGYIPMEGGPVGNMCFGGADGTELFIACTPYLWRIHTTVRDAAQVLRDQAQPAHA